MVYLFESYLTLSSHFREESDKFSTHSTWNGIIIFTCLLKHYGNSRYLQVVIYFFNSFKLPNQIKIKHLIGKNSVDRLFLQVIPNLRCFNLLKFEVIIFLYAWCSNIELESCRVLYLTQTESQNCEYLILMTPNSVN